MNFRLLSFFSGGGSGGSFLPLSGGTLSGPLTIGSFTLSGTNTFFESITGTLHSTSSSSGINVNVTTQGSTSGAFSQGGLFQLQSGKTSGNTAAVSGINNVNSTLNYGVRGITTADVGNGKTAVGVFGGANPGTLISGSAFVGGYFYLGTSLNPTPSGGGVLVLDWTTPAGGYDLIAGYVNGDNRFAVDNAGSVHLGGSGGLGSLIGNGTGSISGFVNLTGLNSLSVNGPISAQTTVNSYGYHCNVNLFTGLGVATDASGDENNLKSFNLPAGTLTKDDQDMGYWIVSGFFAGDAAAKNLRILFGTTNVINFSTSTADDLYWRIQCEIKREGSGEVISGVFTVSNSAGGSPTLIVISDLGLTDDLNDDQAMQVFGTGTGGSSGQVRCDNFNVGASFFQTPD